MEDKEVIKKKTSKKKSSEDEEKVLEAKKKVNELLKGTGLEEPEESEFIDPMSYKQPTGSNQLSNNQVTGANEWLQQQVEALTRQIGEMEAIIVKQQNELNEFRSNGGGGLAQGSDNIKVVELYKYFEGIYTGKSRYGTPFSQAMFSNPQHGTGILDVLLRTFPYLQQYKDYNHWG